MYINLTQHVNQQQQAAGVVDFDEGQKALVRDLLTFEEIPTTAEMSHRARRLVELAVDLSGSLTGGDPFACYLDAPLWGVKVMLGGAPFFMARLEREVRRYGGEPVYAFSRRESVEETQKDGSVAKRNVFRHLGFVEVSS